MTRIPVLGLPFIAGVTALTFAISIPSPGGSPVSAGATMIELDTYRPDNSETSATGPVLEAGQQYAINIQGTYSYWFDFDWENRGVCRGVPEDMPMFPSPGADNGPVGDDAAWSFASPNDLSDCDDPVPDDRSFDVSLDGGDNITEIDPINAGSGPNAEHSYDYVVTGEGEAIVFYVFDSKTEDNYGILKITIETIVTPTPTPAGEPRVWGDDNCSGEADPVDSLLTLRHDAGLGADTGDCPEMAEVVEVALASPHPWGDADCSGGVDPVDSLKLLRHDAGLPVDQEEGCPEIGSQVLIQPSS
jgi:hypothetical protein